MNVLSKRAVSEKVETPSVKPASLDVDDRKIHQFHADLATADLLDKSLSLKMSLEYATDIPGATDADLKWLPIASCLWVGGNINPTKANPNPGLGVRAPFLKGKRLRATIEKAGEKSVDTGMTYEVSSTMNITRE